MRRFIHNSERPKQQFCVLAKSDTETEICPKLWPKPKFDRNRGFGRSLTHNFKLFLHNFKLFQEMIDEADRDGDGEVNQDEFLRIMKKTSLY